MRLKLLAGAALLTAMAVTPLDAATTYVYDTLGRLWVVNYGNGMQVVYTYDSAGNRTSVITQAVANSPPQANNDYIIVNIGGSNTFDPRVNDTDPDGDALTVSNVGTPANGTSSHTGHSVTYTPTAGFSGKDSFTYTISDGNSHTASATVYVTVGGLGPVANPDSISTAFNTAVSYDPRSNDVEPNPPGYGLTITSTTTPSHGTVAIHAGGALLVYTPATGYIGNDTFNYTISDGHGLSSTAANSIAIGVPPTAVDDFVQTPASTAVTFDPRINDSDAQGFGLTVSATTTPAHGAVVINGDSTLTYTPTSGYSGLDTFGYTVSDGHGLSASATDTVCVGYQQPVAVNDTARTPGFVNRPSNPNVTFDPRVNDSGSCGATLTIIAVTQPSQGSATISADGTSITYVYGQEVDSNNILVNTTDSFTYTIADQYGGTATATVTVIIDVSWQGPNQ